MRAKAPRAQLSRLAENPIARVVAYYILLFAATALFLDLVPRARLADLRRRPAVDRRYLDQSPGHADQWPRCPSFRPRPGLPLAEVFAHGRGLRRSCCRSPGST